MSYANSLLWSAMKFTASLLLSGVDKFNLVKVSYVFIYSNLTMRIRNSYLFCTLAMKTRLCGCAVGINCVIGR